MPEASLYRAWRLRCLTELERWAEAETEVAAAAPAEAPAVAEEPAAEAGAAGTTLTLAEAEKAHVARVLRQTGWNITQTARLLNVDRTTVYHKIKQYGLSKD